MIDKLSHSSVLRYKSAGLKMFFSVFTVCICIMSRSFVISIIIFLTMSLLTVVIGKTPLSYYLKLMAVPFLFLTLSTVAIVVDYTNKCAGLICVPAGGGFFSVSTESLIYGISLLFTAQGAVSCMYFLALGTPVMDLLTVLKRIHCPDLLIELMLLIYRFIFILLDLYSSFRISADSRLGNKNFKTLLKSRGQILSTLLMRSLQKASFLYDAMESRCYKGSIYVIHKGAGFSYRDLFFVIFYEIFLIITAFMLR